MHQECPPNLRVSSAFKRVLKEVAGHEQCSIVNTLEVLLCGYCERGGIAPPYQKTDPSSTKRVCADYEGAVV